MVYFYKYFCYYELMRKILLFFVYIFAVFGLIMVIGFFAVKFELTNVKGTPDDKSSIYNDFASKQKESLDQNQNLENSSSTLSSLIDKIDARIKSLEVFKNNEKENLCKIFVVSNYSDYNAKVMFDIYKKYSSKELLDKMVFAFSLKKDIPNFTDQIKNCRNTNITDITLSEKLSGIKNQNIFVWQNSEYWTIIKNALIKDEDKINEVSDITGISSRKIVSIVIVEQLRLYYTQRELFEKVFKPLKILASANKMAWGIMAIKEKTAITIEDNLKDKNSDFYLGKEYENLLDFKTSDKTKERYDRLINEKDHFYSYLYGALYIKQIEAQWNKHGYDISNRPEIISTIFNIGFKNSIPKENPLVGGSSIEILGTKYSFGSLSHEFYYSGEMEDIFPFEN